MRWHIGWQVFASIAIFIGGLFFCSNLQTSDPSLQSTAAERLRPVATGSGTLTGGATVYVPVYSSVYLGLDIKKRMVDLAATVSVRNVSAEQPIVIEWVQYYDSTGKRIRDYLAQPSELRPLASVEFVIQRSDATGGPGANFLIRWKGPATVDEPLIEAVMVGQSGNAGISFASAGRVLKSS
jgi:uncharacterized protein DUF3124